MQPSIPMFPATKEVQGPTGIEAVHQREWHEVRRCSSCGGPTGRRGTSYARAPIASVSWHFDVDSVHPGDEAVHLCEPT